MVFNGQKSCESGIARRFFRTLETRKSQSLQSAVWVVIGPSVPAVFPTMIVVHLSISANALSDATTALTKILASSVRNILGELKGKLDRRSVVHVVTRLICDTTSNMGILCTFWTKCWKVMKCFENLQFGRIGVKGWGRICGCAIFCNFTVLYVCAVQRTVHTKNIHV